MNMSSKIASQEIVELLSDTIQCTGEESSRRLEVCKKCDKFVVEDFTMCSECGCNISFLVTYTFKQCPLNRW
jgi:hypothetical protein